MRLAAAVLILGSIAVLPAQAAVGKVPVARNWTRTVVRTPAGGYLMGNPNAKVKLVEYGSMTCPHCRAFDEVGGDALIRNYVQTGKISYEFRNYVRDSYDLGAALIARCNGAQSFFALTRALFKDQATWIQKAQSATPEQREALKDLAPNRLFLETAKLAGLPAWAAARGIPQTRSEQCLTNTKDVDQLIEMNKAANDQYPDFPGTPAFTVNGKLLEQTASWDALEPQLRAGLGG